MKLNSYKRAGYWPSLKIQYIVFEVVRGPFKNYSFFRQSCEGMAEYLQTIDENDPIFLDRFEYICHAKGVDAFEADAGVVMSDMREGI